MLQSLTLGHETVQNLPAFARMSFPLILSTRLGGLRLLQTKSLIPKCTAFYHHIPQMLNSIFGHYSPSTYMPHTVRTDTVTEDSSCLWLPILCMQPTVRVTVSAVWPIVAVSRSDSGHPKHSTVSLLHVWPVEIGVQISLKGRGGGVIWGAPPEQCACSAVIWPAGQPERPWFAAVV